MKDRVPDDSPRVYWALSGPIKMASSRLHGYSIHESLQSRGWESHLLFQLKHRIDDLPLPVRWFQSPLLFRKGDIVVFQKLVGVATLEALQQLRNRGIATIYIDCDFPPKIPEARLATLTVVSSEFLAELYRDEGISNVKVIGEAFEASQRPRRKFESKKLRCVWFGAMDNIKQMELYALKKLMQREFPDMTLEIISNTRHATINWDFSWDEIKRCDFAVITGTECLTSFCKSSNRLIQAMALGLPVIAYPLPAYKPIIRHGRNGLLAGNEQEWMDALRAISRAEVRKRLAWTGYRYAKRYFGLEQVCQDWMNLFQSIGHRRLPVSRPIDKLKERALLAGIKVEGMQNIATSMRSNVRLQKRYQPNVYSRLFLLSSRPSTRKRGDRG